MDVIEVASDDYIGAQNQSQLNSPLKNGSKRDLDEVPAALDLLEAQESLRASIGSGVGFSRTSGMKQSRTNATSSRRGNKKLIISPESKNFTT